MPPLPPRASANAVHHTRPARAPPVERSDPSASWAAVASWRPLHDAHIATDDSYLDVRVSSLRHHNWDFPLAPRDAIFALWTTTHKALEDVGRSKASLRFALDLALKAPSPLSADIVSDTLELWDPVRTMFDTRYPPTWFTNNIKKARESCPGNRRVAFDSSASDRSVEARRPRHRDEPTSGRGKSKRVMTALNTDSDSGPDSDRDNRPPRQVIPRVFHAPVPLGLAPSFPPRISRTREIHRNDSLHLRPETRPTLGAPMPDRNHLSDGSSYPDLKPQSLEMITAATIVALNNNLASIGYTAACGRDTLGRIDSHHGSGCISDTPGNVTDICDPTPGPVLSSSHPMNNAIHHLQDGRSPATPNHTRKPISVGIRLQTTMAYGPLTTVIMT